MTVAGVPLGSVSSLAVVVGYVHSMMHDLHPIEISLMKSSEDTMTIIINLRMS